MDVVDVAKDQLSILVVVRVLHSLFEQLINAGVRTEHFAWRTNITLPARLLTVAAMARLASKM